MIDPKNVIVKYIINETETNRAVYRILDTESGRMADTTSDIVEKYNIRCEQPEIIQVKNINNYSGRLKTGLNDLDTWCRLNNSMDILEDYNLADNKFKATEISRGSIQKVNWVCHKCNHNWQTILNARTGTHSNCPECMIKAGKYKVHTENDTFINKANKLGRQYLIEEFNEPTIDINKLHSYDCTSIQWKCRKCHKTFNNCVSNRIRGQGCPYCSKAGTSVSEQIIYFALKEYYSDTEYRYKINGYEADIYIPSLNLIIDYRGMYYHKDRDYIDDEKEYFFKSNGYNQIIILADNSYSNTVNNQYIFFNGKNFRWIINKLYNILNINHIVNNSDIDRLKNKALKNRDQGKVLNSVAETNPEIIDIWDFEKNSESGLTPYNITRGTKYKAWFKCAKCSNSYYSPIRKQVIGHRCPVCNGNKTTKENSVGTTNPEILSIWDYDNNDNLGITPYNVKAGSLKRVYIKCRNCGESIDYQVRDIINRKRTIHCWQCYNKFFEDT